MRPAIFEPAPREVEGPHWRIATARRALVLLA